MSHSFPYYHQLDAMDCGPTCLRMVAKLYGSSSLCRKMKPTHCASNTGLFRYGLNGLRQISVRSTATVSTGETIIVSSEGG